MTTDGLLDEAYQRLHATGPEFDGWLSNHGPMAVDALLRLGHGDEVSRWLGTYVRRLQPVPEARWRIIEEDWLDLLGDASRLGDWLALFRRLVRVEPWEQLLARWWPRLLPGAVASAGHGLIRTGHAVRALGEQVTGPRLDELGQALGYWAARWQPLPGYRRPHGVLGVRAALSGVPAGQGNGGIRSRLAQLGEMPTWPMALGALRPLSEPSQVAGALTDLVDAAVVQYAEWAHPNPVMLIHAATAPRAMALALPALPEQLWVASYEMAWAVAAAISVAYRPAADAHSQPHQGFTYASDDLAAQAVELGDEHAIKFAEVAQESHQRGNSAALTSLAAAVSLVGTD